MVYGGSGSGKSAVAEGIIEQLAPCGERIYLATMEPFGADAEERIARHRLMRAKKGFATVERYTDLGGLSLPAGCAALLECLGNLAANELFSAKGAGEHAHNVVARDLAALGEQCAHLVVVSNDIGSDGVDYPAETKGYQRLLGSVNRGFAAECDAVIEVVCGIPIYRKGEGLCRFCGQ